LTENNEKFKETNINVEDSFYISMIKPFSMRKIIIGFE